MCPARAKIWHRRVKMNWTTLVRSGLDPIGGKFGSYLSHHISEWICRALPLMNREFLKVNLDVDCFEGFLLILLQMTNHCFCHQNLQQLLTKLLLLKWIQNHEIMSHAYEVKENIPAADFTRSKCSIILYQYMQVLRARQSVS